MIANLAIFSSESDASHICPTTCLHLQRDDFLRSLIGRAEDHIGCALFLFPSACRCLMALLQSESLFISWPRREPVSRRCLLVPPSSASTPSLAAGRASSVRVSQFFFFPPPTDHADVTRGKGSLPRPVARAKLSAADSESSFPSQSRSRNRGCLKKASREETLLPRRRGIPRSSSPSLSRSAPRRGRRGRGF